MAQRITKDGVVYWSSRLYSHADQKVNLCPPCEIAKEMGAKSPEAPFGWLVYVKSKKELRFYIDESWKSNLSTSANWWEVSERMWQSKVKGEASADDYVTYAYPREVFFELTDWNLGDEVLWEIVTPKSGAQYALITWNCRDEDMPKMLYSSQEKEIYRVIKNTLLIQGDEDLARTLQKNKAYVEMKNRVDDAGNPMSSKIVVWDGKGSILHEFDSDASEQQLINVQPIEL
jgi:hypothetical protein